tara:strand:- start:1480 stop:2523 length:1044 start_codon:yes stop_codon:yes gene_type:complete
MSEALSQFRQSGMNALQRLQQQGQSEKQFEEQKIKGKMSIYQLRDMAEQTGIKAKTDLGQNISMGGIEIHSIYSAMKSKNILSKMNDARDAVRKQFTKPEGEGEGEGEGGGAEVSTTTTEAPTTFSAYTAEGQEGAQIAKVSDIAQDPELFNEFMTNYARPDKIASIAEANDMRPDEVVEGVRTGFQNGRPRIQGINADDEFQVSRQPITPKTTPETQGVSETSFGETPATTQLSTIEGGLGETAEETTTGLLSGLGETLSGVGEAVSGVLGTAGEILGPLGVLASLGFGIYDSIEQSKQDREEKAQAVKTQDGLNQLADKPTFSSGSRAMPSFDTTQFRSGGLMNF